MGKIKKIWQDRGNQYRYAQWLWQYSRPYLGKILLVMVFGLLETVASLLMVQCICTPDGGLCIVNAWNAGGDGNFVAGIYHADGEIFFWHTETDL